MPEFRNLIEIFLCIISVLLREERPRVFRPERIAKFFENVFAFAYYAKLTYCCVYEYAKDLAVWDSFVYISEFFRKLF